MWEEGVWGGRIQSLCLDTLSLRFVSGLRSPTADVKSAARYTGLISGVQKSGWKYTLGSREREAKLDP